MYAMVIVKSTEKEWDTLTDAEQEFDELVAWWANLRASGKVVTTVRLAAPTSTTTVAWRDDQPVVTDGPYIEAKEAVAGLVLLDVATAAEAIEIAKTWPSQSGMRIEVRPTLQRMDR
jgi:hypothetical protein